MISSRVIWSLIAGAMSIASLGAEPTSSGDFVIPAREAEYGFVGASQPHGIFFPGETATITLAVPAKPIVSAEGGYIEMVAVHTRDQVPGEIGFFDNYGKPRLVAGTDTVRIPLSLGDAKDALLQVELPLPETFGTYALTLHRTSGLRTMLGHVLRVLKPTPPVGEIPQLMSSSGPHGTYGAPSLQARLGVRLLRAELHWENSSVGETFNKARADTAIAEYGKHGVKVMVTTGIHPEWSRPFGLGGTCDPRYDAEFARFIEWLVANYYGEPGLWGIENFNEPWEPNGISGWSSDSPRYRDLQKIIYTAAKKVNKNIPILGASSIMNHEDKFLTEGDSSKMNDYVDIFTDHYVQPKGAYGGRMALKWGKLTGETETWGGGSEVLYHHFMAQFLATGNSFLSPVQFDHFATSYWAPPGQRAFYTAKTVAVAMATWNALVQDRPFNGIAFKDHLPFLYQFGPDDDAQLVLVGRLMALQTAREKDVVWPQHVFSPNGTITITDPKTQIDIRDCAGNPVPRAADKSYTLELSTRPFFLRSANGAKAVIEAVRTGKMTGLRTVEILPGSLPFLPEADKAAPLPVRLHNLRNVPVSGTLTVSTVAGNVPFQAKVPFQIAAGVTASLVIPITANANGGLPLQFDAVIDGIRESVVEVVPCTGVTRSSITGIEDRAWDTLPKVVVMRAQGTVAGDEIDKIWKPFLFESRKQNEKLPAKRAELQLAWDHSGVFIRGSVEAEKLGRKPRLADRDDDAFFWSAKDDQTLLAMEKWQRFFKPYMTPGIPPKEWNPTTHPKVKADWNAYNTATNDPQWPEFIAYLEANMPAQQMIHSGLAARFFEARKSRPDASLAEARSVYRPNRDFVAELPFNGDTFQVGIDIDAVEERFVRTHDLPQLRANLPDGFVCVPDTDYEFSAYLCDDDKPELWCLMEPGMPRYHYYPRHVRGPKGQYAVSTGSVEVKRVGEMNVYYMHLTWKQLGFSSPPQPGTDFGFTCRWNSSGGVNFGASSAQTKSNGLTLHPYWQAPPSNTVRWTLLP